MPHIVKNAKLKTDALAIQLLFACFLLPVTAQACSLRFTHPGHGKKVTTPTIVVRGNGAGNAQEGDYGTDTALHNGTPIFQQTGTFTAIILIFPDGRRQPFGRSGTTITAESNEWGTLAASTQNTSAWIYIDKNHMRHEFNADGRNSTFTYNAHGLLASQIDNRGYQILYEYNTRGLETTRTEAAGTAVQRITTTQWHPSLPVPLRRVQPGRIQTWTYDTQGRPLSNAIVVE